MKMIKSLAVLAAFVGICILSFNYVEGHDSTGRKKTIKQQAVKIENLTQQYMGIDGTKRQLEGQIYQLTKKLQQTCALLKAAEIVNSVCEEIVSEPDEKKAETVVSTSGVS